LVVGKVREGKIIDNLEETGWIWLVMGWSLGSGEEGIALSYITRVMDKGRGG